MTIQLTKVDGIYHTKEILECKETQGVLKKKPLLTTEQTRELVKERFDKQIDSRIYREFMRKNSNEAILSTNIKDWVYALFAFIKELYLSNGKKNIYEQENKKREKERKKLLTPFIEVIRTINLPEKIKEMNKLLIQYKKEKERQDRLKKIEKNEKNIILFQYKLQSKPEKNTDASILIFPKLYTATSKNPKEGESFITLFEAFQKELIYSKSDCYKTLPTYQALQDAFKEYRRRKIDKIINSINNNHVGIKKENIQNDTFSLTYENAKTKALHQLTVNILRNALESTEKLKTDTILLLYNEMNKMADVIKLKLLYDNIVESLNEKQWKQSIESRLQKFNKECIDPKNVCARIYKEEVIKYIKNTLSSEKRKEKRENGIDTEGNAKRENPYKAFVKKNFCIKDNSGQKDYEGFKQIIHARFKNRLTAHILDYGKKIYYLQNSKEKELQFTTHDLEYIKATESLMSKLSVIIAFAGHSFYGLFEEYYKDKEGNKDKEDKKDEKDILMDSKIYEVLHYADIYKVNYFFNTGKIRKTQWAEDDRIVQSFEDKSINKNITSEDKSIYYFIKLLQQGISFIRNNVAHFQQMDVKKEKDNVKIFDCKEREQIHTYYQWQYEQIAKRIAEKFLSNNIEQYYSLEEMKQYCDVYEVSLPKTKIPFAPNFKRIKNRGKDLASDPQNKGSDQYPLWQCAVKNNKNEQQMQVRDFLLQELYYNNFSSYFLMITRDFFEIVDKVVKNKQERGESFAEENSEANGAGLSYNVLNKSKKESIEPAQYIANLHKLMMDRLENERFDKDKQKESSKYVVEFVEEICLYGFQEWIQKNKKLQFLLQEDERKIFNTTITKEKFNDTIIDAVTKCLPTKQERTLQKSELFYALYLTLSMVDSKRISQFRNEIEKYICCINNKEERSENDFLGIAFEEYNFVCDFIILTRERLQTNREEETKEQFRKEQFELLYGKTQDAKDKYYEILEKFIDPNLIDYSEERNCTNIEALYSSGDNNTPILHSNLEKSRQFVTQDFLARIFKENRSFRYTQNDNKQYRKQQENIEDRQDRFRTLHKEWVKAENKEDKKKEIEKKYREVSDKIREYNYLEHKKTLQTVYILHEITCDIMARYIGYLNKFERDFQFFMIGLQYCTADENVKDFVNKFLDPNKLSDEIKKKINKKEKKNDELEMKKPFKTIHFSIGGYRDAKEDSFKDDAKKKNIDTFIKDLFYKSKETGKYVYEKEEETIDFRNYIAHFACTRPVIDSKKNQPESTPSEEQNQNSKGLSFLEQMNGLIRLFSYDRKVMNQVNKSIKKILKRYNIEIDFEITEEYFKKEPKNTQTHSKEEITQYYKDKNCILKKLENENVITGFTYNIKYIESVNAEHLGKGNNAVKIPLVSDEILDMVNVLLQYKNGCENSIIPRKSKAKKVTKQDSNIDNQCGMNRNSQNSKSMQGKSMNTESKSSKKEKKLS